MLVGQQLTVLLTRLVGTAANVGPSKMKNSEFILYFLSPSKMKNSEFILYFLGIVSIGGSVALQNLCMQAQDAQAFSVPSVCHSILIQHPTDLGP